MRKLITLKLKDPWFEKQKRYPLSNSKYKTINDTKKEMYNKIIPSISTKLASARQAFFTTLEFFPCVLIVSMSSPTPSKSQIISRFSSETRMFSIKH
jgi:hypothetical protein